MNNELPVCGERVGLLSGVNTIEFGSTTESSFWVRSSPRLTLFDNANTNAVYI
jgi:hypothetical protein